MKKLVASVTIFLLTVSLCVSALAAEFPSRPVSVTNPFLPGGVVDLGWRPVSEGMTKALGQTIVNNVATGAGGVLGITKFAKGKADGYNVLLCSDGTFIATSKLRKVRYNVDDYVSLGAFAQAPQGLTCNKDETRWTDLKSFVAYAKAHPGELSMGLTGMLTQQHVSTLLMLERLGIELKLIPFDGELNSLAAVGSKHIDLTNASMLKNESIRVLALFGDKTDLYPEASTFKDAGYDIHWVVSWHLYVHKNTPQEQKKILTDALLKAASDPASQAILRSLGQIPTAIEPEKANKLMHDMKAFIDNQVAAGTLKPEK